MPMRLVATTASTVVSSEVARKLLEASWERGRRHEAGVFTEPQLGATHADLLRIALYAEELEFDGFFRSDHYPTMPGLHGLPGPSDAWATLAALAVQTSRIRLGAL